MTENENITEQETSNNQYIDAINELKSKTVSKDEYDQLKSENAQLLKSILNGEQIDVQQTNEPVADVDELRNKLFDGRQLSNLEGWKAALELREALMAKGDRDPFADFKIDPKNNDLDSLDKAQRVADIVKECIEYADGDSELFTNELMRRTVDYKTKR